jgi:hypothetical protein
MHGVCRDPLLPVQHVYGLPTFCSGIFFRLNNFSNFFGFGKYANINMKMVWPKHVTNEINGIIRNTHTNHGHTDAQPTHIPTRLRASLTKHQMLYAFSSLANLAPPLPLQSTTLVPIGTSAVLTKDLVPISILAQLNGTPADLVITA